MLSLYITLLLVLLGLIIRFPVSSVIELKQFRRKKFYWDLWSEQLPTRLLYRADKKISHEQNLQCDFCGSERIFSRREQELPSEVSFGIFQNNSLGSIAYESFRCSGCGTELCRESSFGSMSVSQEMQQRGGKMSLQFRDKVKSCLLYTSPSPRDYAASRMPSSA